MCFISNILQAALHSKRPIEEVAKECHNIVMFLFSIHIRGEGIADPPND